MLANPPDMEAGYGNGNRFRGHDVVAMNHDDSTGEPMPPRRLSEKEAAYYLGVLSVRTLQDWRRKRIGPTFCRLGRRVAYAISDLDTFLKAGRVESKDAPLREPSA